MEVDEFNARRAAGDRKLDDLRHKAGKSIYRVCFNLTCLVFCCCCCELQAKAINFGIPGGEGVDTLRDYVANGYGVLLTTEEAAAYRFDRFSIFLSF